MRTRILALVLGALFSLVGCSNGSNAQIEELGAQITDLQRQIADMRSALDQHKQAVSDNAADLFGLRVELRGLRHDKATLSATPGGYSRLDSDSGSFLIAVDDVQPYLNGYKLVLQIGNPMNATFKGFDLNVRFGTAYNIASPPKGLSYSEWNNSLRSIEKSYTASLLPGQWNRAELVIAPVTAEELGHLEIKIDTNTISLGKG